MEREEKIHIKQLNLDKINPSSKNYMNPSQGGSKIVIIGKPGCFAKSTNILLYDGTIKKVEDVKVHEKVMGWDSTPRNVLELCRNTDEMFEITPVKGDKVVVNKKHILTLKCTGYNSHKKGEIIDISVEDYLKKSTTFQNRYKWFRTGVEFEQKDNNTLPFDPYSVGLWLGDGTSAETTITTIDPEIVDYLKNYFEEKDYIITKKGKEPSISYYIRSKEGTKGKNGFKNFLRDNNMLNNKHIPHNYKTSNRQDRLRLLAGILDTDGYYDSNVFEITQKSKKLSDDIVFLSRSLGFSCYQKEVTKICCNNGSSGTYYRHHISGDGLEEIPTKLQRKQAHSRRQTKDALVTGFEIKSIGEDQYYGFTTDGDHRFLLADFSVVHNSGKSTLIADILYSKKDIFPVAMAMSGTEDSNHFFKNIMPSTFVYNDYQEDKVVDFIKRQKLAKQHLQNPWAVLIIDDCTDDPRIFRRPLQNSLYKLGERLPKWC